MTKLVAFYILALMLLPVVSANAGAYMMITSAANSNAIAEADAQATRAAQGGCMPPIEFSTNYSCKLEIAGRYSVNEYYCYGGDTLYTIEGDCKGGALSYRAGPNPRYIISRILLQAYKPHTPPSPYTYKYVVIIIFAMAVLFGIFEVIQKRTKIKKTRVKK